MNKKVILLSILISGLTTAQVGINTDTPKTTMDVSAKRASSGAITDNTQTVGMQAPRLTRLELSSLTSTYGTNQNGALIYVTDVADGNTTGQRVNVKTPGYYYFDSGLNVWQKLTPQSTEPWNIELTTDPAISNKSNIYQDGFIGISSSTSALPRGTRGYFETRAIPRALSITGDGLASDDIYIQSFTNVDALSSAQVTQVKTRGNVGAVTRVFNGDSTGFLKFGANGTDGTTPSYLESAYISGVVGVGTISATSVPIDLTFFTGTNNVNPVERVRITNTGNVGIGTPTPGNKLEVTGAPNTSGMRLTNLINAPYLKTDGNGDIISTPAPADLNTNIYTDDGTLAGNRVVTMANRTLGFAAAPTAGTSHFTVDGTTFNVDALNDRVGIGSAVPVQKLDVAGFIKSNALTNGAVAITSGDYGIYNQSTTNWLRISSPSNSSIAFLTDASGTNGFSGSNVPTMLIRQGNVGIGTGSSDPGKRLDIATGVTDDSGVRLRNLTSATYLGTNGAGDIVKTPAPADINTNIYTDDGTLAGNRVVTMTNRTLGFTAAPTAGTSHFTIDGTTFNVNALNDRVGIGFAAPAHKLDVDGTVKSKALTNGAVAMSTGDYGIYNQEPNNWLRIASTPGSSIAFFTDAATGNQFSGGGTPVMLVRQGKVGIGIGSATPGNTLEVNGTASLSGIQLSNMINVQSLGTDGEGNIVPIYSNNTARASSGPLATNATHTFTAAQNFKTALVNVTAVNGCGRTMIVSFTYTSGSLLFLNGVARDKVAAVVARTIPPNSLNEAAEPGYTVSFAGVDNCGDGGGGTQFDFYIQLGALTGGFSTLKLTNKGNITKTFNISVISTE